MDNDDKVNNPKITEIVKRDTSLFFEKRLNELSTERKVYNLDEEFAKTKKNRSPIVPLVIAVMVVVLAAAAVIVTQSIDRGIRSTPVDIQAFEDVNLKDLLDTAKKNQQDLERVQQETDSINAEYKGNLDRLESERKAGLEMNANLKLASADLVAKNAQVNAASDAKVNAVKNKYDPMIAQKRKERDAIQKKIDAYDTRAMDQAKKQQEVLDNQQRLADMNMATTKSYYEGRLADAETTRRQQVADAEAKKNELVNTLKKNHAAEVADLIAKYNPTWTDSRTASLLAGTAAAPFAQSPFPPILAQENVISKDDYDALAQNVNDMLYLSGKLRAVPYINSVPGTLSQVEAKAVTAATSYQRTLEALSRLILQKNAMIQDLTAQLASAKTTVDRYNYSFNIYTSDLREAGFILDPRDSANILVYINPLYSVTDGMTGWVFRHDDEFIGSVQFKQVGNSIIAVSKDIENGKSIAPFDMILFKLQSQDAQGGQP
jgi:hypothetical protein